MTVKEKKQMRDVSATVDLNRAEAKKQEKSNQKLPNEGNGF